MNQPLTPEQTKSAYQLVCEQECEGCAKGIPRVKPFMSPYVHRLEYAVSMDDDFPCAAPSKEALIERQAAKIAALQAALDQGGHAEDCNLSHNHGPECPECRVAVCNCHLAALSDDIERGKELLGAVEAKEKAERERDQCADAYLRQQERLVAERDGARQASRYNADVATQARAEAQRQAVEIEELRKALDPLSEWLRVKNGDDWKIRLPRWRDHMKEHELLIMDAVLKYRAVEKP